MTIAEPTTTEPGAPNPASPWRRAWSLARGLTLPTRLRPRVRLPLRPSRRPLAVRFAELELERERLDRVAHAMEVKFLAAGAGVQQLAVLSERLLKDGDRLAWLSDPTNARTQVLHQAVELIRSQLAFAEQCQVANARLVTRLRGYTDQVASLRRCEEGLARILTPLQVVGTLYKIQAASLSAEEMTFFTSLTQEISTLQQEAWRSFGEQFAGLNRTRETVRQSLPALEEQIRLQQQHLAATQQNVEASLQAFQAELAESQARRTRLAESGQAIQAATGAAVMGLQYQDITRQKWEHVTMALQEMQNRAASLSAATPQEIPPVSRFLRDTSRVQVRQIQGIEEDLAKAQTSISDSLHTILGTLRTMDEECQRMCGTRGGASGAVEQMIQVLLTTLTGLRSWMTSVTQVASTTRETVGSLDQEASNVAVLLRRLALGINLIALNAQIQSARIGEGTGLGVLSESTCGAAGEIRRFSEAEGAAFDALSRELSEIVHSCQELSASVEREDHRLADRDRELESQLVECRTHVAQSVAEVRASLQELHLEATAALDTTDFQTSFQDSFVSLRDVLTACATAAADECPAEALPTDPVAEADQLRRNYTMDSERAAHEEVLGVGFAPETAPPDIARETFAAAPQAELAPRLAEAPIAPAAEPGSASSETERPRGTAVAPALATPASDLGDNVELF